MYQTKTYLPAAALNTQTPCSIMYISFQKNLVLNFFEVHGDLRPLCLTTQVSIINLHSSNPDCPETFKTIRKIFQTILKTSRLSRNIPDFKKILLLRAYKSGRATTFQSATPTGFFCLWWSGYFMKSRFVTLGIPRLLSALFLLHFRSKYGCLPLWCKRCVHRPTNTFPQIEVLITDFWKTMVFAA